MALEAVEAAEIIFRRSRGQSWAQIQKEMDVPQSKVKKALTDVRWLLDDRIADLLQEMAKEEV